MNDGSSHIQYLLKNHQGSLAEVAGSDGQVTESYSFDAFGRRRNAQTWTLDNLPTSFGIDRGYKFHSLSREERNGKHLDDFELINPDTLHCIALSGSATANFSLHCVCENQASAGMNGRMGVYPESPEHSGRFGNPLVARFLSPDPFIQNPEYSQSYNRYSYVFNNPLRFVDPSGYFVEGDSTGGYNWSIPNLFPKAPYRIPEIYETNTDVAQGEIFVLRYEGEEDHSRNRTRAGETMAQTLLLSARTSQFPPALVITLGGGSLLASYYYLRDNFAGDGNANYPGPLSYTYQHHSQNPIHQNQNTSGGGNGNWHHWVVGGTFSAGILYFYLKSENLKTQKVNESINGLDQSHHKYINKEHSIPIIQIDNDFYKYHKE